MGKKKNKKKNKQKQINYDLLPQNIITVGEHVEEDKRIYIHQNVYKEIQKFTEDKTKNESGGVLVGNVIEELGKTNIIIRAFVEAKHSEGTPTTLTFTHESWEYIHGQIDKHYPKLSIVGWIHTHPDFGIFLSEYDKFIQNNFFDEDNQVAYVVDPIRKEEGFYFWINDAITKCPGFYIFDEVGEEISVSILGEDDSFGVIEDIDEKKPKSKVPIVLGVLLGIAVIVIIAEYLVFSSKLDKYQMLPNPYQQDQPLLSPYDGRPLYVNEDDQPYQQMIQQQPGYQQDPNQNQQQETKKGKKKKGKKDNKENKEVTKKQENKTEENNKQNKNNEDQQNDGNTIVVQ